MDVIVMAEIILSMYNIFISKKVITDITSNLFVPKIEMVYGNRIRSKLREILNLIAFDKEVEYKRK